MADRTENEVTRGARVIMTVQRQWAHGRFWPSRRYVGTVERVYEHANLGTRVDVRTRRGGILWECCDPSCVAPKDVA